MSDRTEEMGEVRSIDTAREASTDLVALNNVIVNMRSCAKATKVQIMHKLTRTIQKLKKKKGTEEEIAKNLKKAQRMLDEVFVIKELNLDKVSKFALQNTTSFDETSRQPSVTTEARCLARLSEHKLLATSVKAFRDTHSDWRELAAFLYTKQTGRRFKTKKQKLRAAEKGKKSQSRSINMKENDTNFKRTASSEINKDRHHKNEDENAQMKVKVDIDVKHSDEKKQLSVKRQDRKMTSGTDEDRRENVRNTDAKTKGKKSSTKRKELGGMTDSDDQDEEEESCEDSSSIYEKTGQVQVETENSDASEEEDSDNNGSERTVNSDQEEQSDESIGEHGSSVINEDEEKLVEDDVDNSEEEDSVEEEHSEEEKYSKGKEEESEEEDDSEVEGDDSDREESSSEEEDEGSDQGSDTHVSEEVDVFKKPSEPDAVHDPFFICDDEDASDDKPSHWITASSLKSIEKENKRGGHSWQKGHNMDLKGDRYVKGPNDDSRWLYGDVDAEDFRQGRGGFSRGRGDSTRGAGGSGWKGRGSRSFGDHGSDSFQGRGGRGSDTFRGRGGRGSDTFRGRGGRGSDTFQGRGGRGSDTFRGRGGRRSDTFSERGGRSSDTFRGYRDRDSRSDSFQGRDWSDRRQGNNWRDQGRGGGQGPRQKTDVNKDQGQVDFSHPSWDAKRKRKEMEKTASFSGKRIKFDD